MMRTLRMLAVLFVLAATAKAAEQPVRPNQSDRPNIVLILCDDLGYGDVSYLNPKYGKIQTPHIDRLAQSGMTFTDAHSGSSVCTPTRYGLLTGRYSWRTRLQSGVVTGFAPSLISKDRPTLASFLKSNGYHTACIGKWHLNFIYQDADSGKVLKKKDHRLPPIGSSIPDGPVDRGFDHFHGFHHAREMEAVIENRKVIEHDAVENMLPRLTQKAVDYIHQRASARSPFFLYLPLGSPHTPIVPTEAWKGKSGLGDYADFVMQTDDTVGQVLNALKKNHLTQNTLILFSSDNGCSKAANIDALTEQGHWVSAGMRGSKADIWDGGHRVPLLISWPSHISPHSSCDHLVCLNDLFATLADAIGAPVPSQSCEDSLSFFQALKNPTANSARTTLIHHSISGHFAFRNKAWKLILAKGSAGWTSPKEHQVPEGTSGIQLYDLKQDYAEENNLHSAKPELVNQLIEQLKKQIQNGRTTEGEDSYNDIETIKLWKSGTPDRSTPMIRSQGY